jgi:hypothetical protein
MTTLPRYAVLTLAFDLKHCPRGYVIYDQGTGRIVDGVYAVKDMALAVAGHCCLHGPPDDMTPHAEALGLLFPPGPRGRKAHA